MADTQYFLPPKPATHNKRFLARALTGAARANYLANFIKQSYSMKMGQIWAPRRNIFMPNQYELVRRMLVTDAEIFPKSDMLESILKLLIGNGVFVANGQEWKRQRRLIDPAFAHAKLKNVFPAMIAAVDGLLQRVNDNADGAIVAIDEEMTHITADVIFRTIFSVSLEQAEAKQLFTAFNRFQDAAFAIGFVKSIGLPNIFFYKNRQARTAARDIRNLIKPFILERYTRHKNGEAIEENDILTSLVTARDPETGDGFSLEELIDQTAVLFLAGHETSASALSWALYLIANSPDVQERIHSEAVEAFSDILPEYKDIKKLRFVRDVFQETLRLYPPVGFLPREATQCEHMRGKSIKPGDIFLISPWLIHRHTDYWQDPDVFNPDRYKDGASKESLRQAYLPFSMGPRICPGAGFAKQEAMIVLASLVRRYKFDPVPDHVPVPVGRLTIRSANGIRLKVTRR